ncbi:MAG: DUF2127 domain-containing protein [Pseudorhodobacter sp.]|nr:DUF2127 domain-containing protein [Pseudorhodobacter sp.]
MRASPASRLNRRLHAVFEVSLLAKALFAAGELVSGIALWLVKADWVNRWADALTRAELIEDPNDRLAAWALSVAHNLSVETQHFWALYLIWHASVKLVVVVALIAGIGWAYPASVVVLAGFIVYQLDRFLTSHSLWMLALSLFDMVVVWLVVQEYHTLRNNAKP